MGFMVRRRARLGASRSRFRARGSRIAHSRYDADIDQGGCDVGTPASSLDRFAADPSIPASRLPQSALGFGPASDGDASSERTSHRRTTRTSASESGWLSQSRVSSGDRSGAREDRSSVFSLPRSHASNRGGMFGARGGVGGASTEHALRRPHAGAETREELERLPDDVLRVIVNDARAKLRKQERLRLREEAERAAELADVVANDSDGEDGQLANAVPKADPVAETVLHMGDDDEDALDALAALGEKREKDETQARAELARGVLAARLAMRAGARRRLCLSISRETRGRNEDAVAVIHPEDFERFVHRGGDAEGVDARQVARLYACCLPGRPGSRAAAADALDAHQLLRVVESGRWRRHWARYVRDARQRALEHGACAGALAVFGATSRDPFADAASDAKIAKRSDAGFPDPDLFGAFGSFRAFARYARFCVAFVTLPVLAPLSRRRGPFQTHAEAWYVSRFALPESLRGSRTSFAAAAPLALVAAPYWSLGVVSLVLYVLRQPEYLLVDVLVPVVLAAFTTSLAAACAGAAVDFGAARPRTRRESGKFRPSHAFPGGRAALPDDSARVAQDDPRGTRQPAKHREGGGGSFKVALKASPPADREETRSGPASSGPASSGADSARTHAGFGSFGAARIAAAAATPALLPDALASDADAASAAARGTDADARFDASAGVGLDGEPRRSRKGRRGLAAAGRGPEREKNAPRAANEFERHASEETVDGATTTTTTTTEKDVADAVMRRAAEETASLSARGGFLGAYLGSAPLTVRQRLAFAATALAVAAIPAAHRLGTGVELFGGADTAFVCVDRLLPDAASALLGLETCSSLEMAANATDADADGADYADYSPRLSGAAEAVSAESRAGDAGSATGAAIVGAAALWTAAGAYAALTSTRWITSRAHAHYVRMRVFAAVTDPAEAAACDVPFLNLRKASLPWVRLRAHLRRARALERRWVALCVSHLTVAAAACALAAALAAARAHSSPHARADASAVAFCVLAAAFAAPLAVLLRVAAHLARLSADDDALLARERWRVAVDAEDLETMAPSSFEFETTKETERTRASANARREAFEKERRARERESARLDAAYAAVRESRDPEDFSDAPPATARARADLAAFATAALLVAIVALTLLDLFGGPYQGMTTDALGVVVEANFAYTHAYHESLGARLARLAENVTRVEAGVGEAASLVAVLDNVSAREALNAVNALTASLENGGCVA